MWFEIVFAPVFDQSPIPTNQLHQLSTLQLKIANNNQSLPTTTTITTRWHIKQNKPFWKNHARNGGKWEDLRSSCSQRLVKCQQQHEWDDALLKGYDFQWWPSFIDNSLQVHIMCNKILLNENSTLKEFC